MSRFVLSWCVGAVQCLDTGGWHVHGWLVLAGICLIFAVTRVEEPASFRGFTRGFRGGIPPAESDVWCFNTRTDNWWFWILLIPSWRLVKAAIGTKRSPRLAAGLAAAWEAEVVSAKTLSALAERAEDMKSRARLMVLAAFCRAHASRLLTRLADMGRVPLPVPDDVIVDGDLSLGLHHGAFAARSAAARYAAMADVARSRSDYSSAWVCELNRAEEEDCAEELMRMGNGAEPVALHAAFLVNPS
jgi:hypothetical protein